MNLATAYLPLLPNLGHLPRPVRVRALERVCQAIRDDLRERGPDPQLMLIGSALGYCASLLRDAGDDGAGDRADAALAQLDDELRALLAELRAALYRPAEDAHRAAAAALLCALFPSGGLPETLTAARRLARQGHTAILQRALDVVGLRPQLHQVELALAEVDRRLDACAGRTEAVLQRARGATRMADGLLCRLVGHLTAATDPADPEQRQRALALLQPLRAEEEVLAPSWGGGAVAERSH